LSIGLKWGDWRENGAGDHFIPIIVSNCALPLVIPSGKQAVFHEMDAQFETRKRLNRKFQGMVRFSPSRKMAKHGPAGALPPLFHSQATL
jgi:hypothetical protein